MGRVVIPGFRKIETSGGGGGGTSNYNDLTNKPSINNVPLVGKLKTVDLKLTDATLTEEGVPADAKAVGTKLEESVSGLKGDLVNYTSNYDNGIKRIDDEWIYGSIESDGSIYPYNDRITCKNFHVADRTIPIHIDEEFQIIYVEYNSDLTVKHRYANHRTDFEITKGIIFRLSIYRRNSISGEKASIPLFSYKVTTNTNTIYEIDRLKKFENVFITVDPTATKSEFVYQKFSDGLAKAMEYENATLYVKAHTYDILSELGGSDYTENYHTSSENSGIGLRIGKGVKIIAEENTLLVAEYNGTNRDFGFNFSILNAIGSFELNGITLKARNIRYCVHEDVPVIDSTVDSYTAIYKNCKMYHFANNEYGYSGVYCIGASVYHNSRTEIENCYFYADGEYSNYPVEYHNYETTNVEHSTVIIKDNYFVGEKGLRFYGFSPDGSIIDAFVSNNKIGRDVAINGTTNRINLRKWNNTIDTN